MFQICLLSFDFSAAALAGALELTQINRLCVAHSTIGPSQLSRLTGDRSFKLRKNMKINYPAIESRLMDERENSEPETRPLNDRIIGRLQRDPMTSVGSRKNTREEIEINRIENH